MTFNLAPASKKKVLTPNPSPDRMLAVECEVAANVWFRKAMDLAASTNLTSQDKIKYYDEALAKAAMYENMMHDGRA